MTCKTGISLIFLTLLWASNGIAKSATPGCAADPLTAELLLDEDNFRALSRMRETEFQLRGSNQGFICAKEIFGLYLQHHEFSPAERWLDNHLQSYSQLTRDNYRLWKVELAYLYGNYTEAVARSQDLSEEDRERPVVYASYRLQRGTPTTAKPKCQHNSCHEIDLVFQDPKLNSHKSVIAGAALGVIPGAGQMYAGRWGAGIGSFLINSLFIGLTIYASQRGENAAALLSGVGAATLYAGSIYAGYEATKRYNERMDQQREQRVQDLRLGLTLPIP